MGNLHPTAGGRPGHLLSLLLDRAHPDGYLLLGAAETTMNLDEAYHREVFARTGSYYRLGR